MKPYIIATCGHRLESIEDGVKVKTQESEGGRIFLHTHFVCKKCAKKYLINHETKN